MRATLFFPSLVLVLVCSGAAVAADWPMYGQNPQRTFANVDAGPAAITPANASLLVRRWVFPTTDAVTASPAVAEGTVYVGAWDGFFYALDAATGIPKWTFQVDCDPAVNPGTLACLEEGRVDPVQSWPVDVDRVTDDGGVITSSAAVVDVEVSPGTFEQRVFFGGGKTLYALRASDGERVWKTVLCGNPEGFGRPVDYDCENDGADHNRVFTSPLVVEVPSSGKTMVFVGTSVDGQLGYHGRMMAFDAVDGSELWDFHTANAVSPRTDPNDPSRWDGCDNVWSSSAWDPTLERIYFGVSDCHFASPPPFTGRLLALDAASGALEAIFTPGLIDRGELPCDYAIGATPNLFDLGNEKLAGVGRKDGFYYVFDRTAAPVDPLNEPVAPLRELRAGPPGGVAGGFIGSPAYDAGLGMILGATALGDTPGGCLADPLLPVSLQEPSLHGMKVDGSGQGDWHRYLNQSFGASAVANGVLYTGTHLLQDFRVFDAATGDLLALFPMGASVNSGAAVADGMVFVGSGNSEKYNSAGMHAFSLPMAPLP